MRVVNNTRKRLYFILKFPVLSIMDQGGAHGPHPSLLNYWLLLDSGEETGIAFSCVPNGEPTRLQWAVQICSHRDDPG